MCYTIWHSKLFSRFALAGELKVRWSARYVAVLDTNDLLSIFIIVSTCHVLSSSSVEAPFVVVRASSIPKNYVELIFMLKCAVNTV